jgi:hypothetical protein
VRGNRGIRQAQKTPWHNRSYFEAIKVLGFYFAQDSPQRLPHLGGSNPTAKQFQKKLDSYPSVVVNYNSTAHDAKRGGPAKPAKKALENKESTK